MLLRTIAVVFGCLLFNVALPAQTVAVRYPQGLVHGFLALSTMEGTQIAEGDLTQVARGSRVTSRLTFHFKDGSLQDETTVFSQHGNFRLISDHLVQKGPAFKNASDVSVIAATGEVTVRYTDDKGKEKVESERLKLPPDVSNGLVPILLENLRPGDLPPNLSLVVATPKPRIVKLSINSPGSDAFSLGGSSREAKHYVIKVDIGGVAGLVAPVLGKQPPDAHVWILGGEAPVFVKSETLSYMGGPLWRTELLSPVWPKSDTAEAKDGVRGRP